MAIPISPERALIRLEMGRAARSIRKRLGLTQAAFSEKVLLRQNKVSQLESGRFALSVAKLFELLRLAATEDERGPILRALATAGIRTSDLSPSLASLPSDSISESQRAEVQNASGV